MRILYYDPFCRGDPVARELGAEYVSLDTLYTESDFITLHVPLTPDTHHLINADALRKCKSTAILINTSRGPVVDVDALYRALRDGDIAYAALDVTDPEPIAVDSPLLTLPNAIVVPHIASASVATRARMAVIAAQNLLAGLCDEPLPAWVNPEVRR
jgi:glyoxylate reductase